MDSLKKELVSLRIPEILNRKLAEYVAPLGMSKNAFILSLIYRELKIEAEHEQTANPAQHKVI